jgi:hypothetical protein
MSLPWRVDGDTLLIERASGVRWGRAILTGLLAVPGLFFLLNGLLVDRPGREYMLLIGGIWFCGMAIPFVRAVRRPPGRPLAVLDATGFELAGGRRIRWDNMKRIHAEPEFKNGSLTRLRVEPVKGNAILIDAASLPMSRGTFVALFQARGVEPSVELLRELRLAGDDPESALITMPATVEEAIDSFIEGGLGAFLTLEERGPARRYVQMASVPEGIQVEAAGPGNTGSEFSLAPADMERLRSLGYADPIPEIAHGNFVLTTPADPTFLLLLVIETLRVYGVDPDDVVIGWDA